MFSGVRWCIKKHLGDMKIPRTKPGQSAVHDQPGAFRNPKPGCYTYAVTPTGKADPAAETGGTEGEIWGGCLPSGSLCCAAAGFVHPGEGKAPATPPGHCPRSYHHCFGADPVRLCLGRGMGRRGIGEWNDQC